MGRGGVCGEGGARSAGVVVRGIEGWNLPDTWDTQPHTHRLATVCVIEARDRNVLIRSLLAREEGNGAQEGRAERGETERGRRRNWRGEKSLRF